MSRSHLAGIYLFILVAGTLTRPGSALAAPTCAATHDSQIGALSSIELVPMGFAGRMADVPQRAADLWNRASCNSGNFPRFVLGTRGERILELRWISGPSPSGSGVCGAFSGSQILLYASARDRTGAIRDCGGPERIVESLAHELGHALGLTDRHEPECRGRIMSQLNRLDGGAILPRRLSIEECAVADLRFETGDERWAAAFNWSGVDSQSHR